MPDAKAPQFDAAADFSHERNPNGPWSYGSASRPGEFLLFPQRKTDAMVRRWGPSREVVFPDVHRNLAGKVVFRDGALMPGDSLILRPGHQLLHPTTYSVVRFTAPSHGAYRFRGQFEAVSLDYGGTTQVILHGARKLAENTFINAHGQIWEFDLRQDLRPDECVDFLVGNSPNGDNSNDSTGLIVKVEWRARLSPLWPTGLAGAAMAGLVAWRVRRRRAFIARPA